MRNSEYIVVEIFSIPYYICQLICLSFPIVALVVWRRKLKISHQYYAPKISLSIFNGITVFILNIVFLLWIAVPIGLYMDINFMINYWRVNDIIMYVVIISLIFLLVKMMTCGQYYYLLFFQTYMMLLTLINVYMCASRLDEIVDFKRLNLQILVEYFIAMGITSFCFYTLISGGRKNESTI